ncbi:MAG TPA: CdaR family protein [Candidatus Paceibacterota bacterium]|nr:CdaR family protein [Candidatus Paceibacterota bacterium]
MIDFLRNLIFRDFWLKFLSFVFAVLIWLTVWKVFLSKEVSPMAAFGSRQTEQSYYGVPVLVIFPAADIRNVIVDPGEVQVTVQGDSKVLQNLKPTDIHAQVDLTGIESTRGMRKRIVVQLPTGVIYTRVVPDEVEVVIPPKK